jgi:hypothetical protein
MSQCINSPPSPLPYFIPLLTFTDPTSPQISRENINRYHLYLLINTLNRYPATHQLTLNVPRPGAANLNSFNSASFFSDARKCSVLAIYIFPRSILSSIRLHSRSAPPREASQLRRQHVVLNRDMALIYPTRSLPSVLFVKTWRCISPVLHLHWQSFCSKNYVFVLSFVSSMFPPEENICN